MSTSHIDVSSSIASLKIGPVTPIAPVTGRADAAIWRVEHDCRISALRVRRPEQAPIGVIERVAGQAVSATLPVPKIRAATIWSGQTVP